MAYIFLDESGDLGFKKKSSKWFLFTLVVIDNPRPLEKVISKARTGLKKKYKHRFSELHAYHCDDVTRTRILKSLARLDIAVITTILNKRKVYVDLQNQKNYLYNYTANVILDRLINSKLIANNHEISLVADRKDTKKNLRDNFISYITEAMKKRRDGNFKMSLAASHDERGLQAVDFISWSIFRKYEKDDLQFYDFIKSKIIDERLLFP
jgi:undecaprenyl pyrophosphate synthase